MKKSIFLSVVVCGFFSYSAAWGVMIRKNAGTVVGNIFLEPLKNGETFCLNESKKNNNIFDVESDNNGDACGMNTVCTQSESTNPSLIKSSVISSTSTNASEKTFLSSSILSERSNSKFFNKKCSIRQKDSENSNNNIINDSLRCNLFGKLSNGQENKGEEPFFPDNSVALSGKCNRIEEQVIYFSKKGKEPSKILQKKICREKMKFFYSHKKKTSAALMSFSAQKEILEELENKMRVITQPISKNIPKVIKITKNLNGAFHLSPNPLEINDRGFSHCNKCEIYTKKLSTSKMNTKNARAVYGYYNKKTVAKINNDKNCSSESKIGRVNGAVITKVACIERSLKMSEGLKKSFAQWIEELKKADKAYKIADCLSKGVSLLKSKEETTLGKKINSWNNQSPRNKYKQANGTKDEILNLLKGADEKAMQALLTAQS